MRQLDGTKEIASISIGKAASAALQVFALTLEE
jgi:hypothetical protein